jgi:acyl-coenzyme A synthetase/AMP-(fatty) acid ligase
MNVHVRFFTVAALAALAAGAVPLAAQSAAQPVSDRAPDAPAAAVVVPTALVSAPLSVPLVDSITTVVAPAETPAATTVAARGPSLASARVASHAVSTPHGAPPVLQNKSSNKNAIALMAVGGAALIIGAVISDDAGTIVMLGGAVIGLYGLYLFLT